MKSIIKPTIITALASYILMMFTPWWIVSIVGFVVAYMFVDSPIKAFFSGLIGVGVLWVLLAIIKDSGANVSVANALGNVVGGVPAYLMYIITGLTGGAVGGLGAMSGTYARLIFYRVI